jgi:hypothetical protein
MEHLVLTVLKALRVLMEHLVLMELKVLQELQV